MISGRLGTDLLVVFDVLMQERDVARSAARLGLSWRDLDSTLLRLRDRFDDELFVEGEAGLTPTLRAEQIAKELNAGTTSAGARLLSCYCTSRE